MTTQNNTAEMARRVLELGKDKVNRNAKDSIFTDLFEKPEYLIQLYRVLHPEDTETTEDDLTIVTLENLMMRGRYNDLGFLVGNRLVILVEAQSTWSINIVTRFLIYIAKTYDRYIRGNQLDLYGSKKIDLPAPELYVIYTGLRTDCPETISLSRDIFGAASSSVDVTVRVITDSEHGDILSQYFGFARIFDAQVRAYGLTKEAVDATLRICSNEDILREYLKREEVPEKMISIIDQEWQRQLEIKREREEEREEACKERDAETARIIDYLLDHDRYEDARRVNKDKDFRQQILDEIDNQ